MSNEQKTILNRRIAYWGSLVFLLLSLYLALIQTSLLKWLFQTQVSFSWQNVLLLFSDSNWLDTLTQKLTNATILVGVVLIIEILFFIGLILFFLIYLLRMRKNGLWLLSDWLLFIGHATLLVGSLVCGYVVITSSLQTMTTLQGNFQKVSPAEMQLLAKNLTLFLEKFTFSLTTIFKDISTLVQGAQKIIGNVKQIAATPTILQNWLDTLNQWRLYFVFCFSGSAIVILLGMLLRLRSVYPQLLRRKKKIAPIKMTSTDERLLTILEQQQVLLEKLAEPHVTSSEKPTTPKEGSDEEPLDYSI